jgi:cytochrome c peroxidase
MALAAAASASAATLSLALEPRWRGAPVSVPSAPLANDAGQSLRLTRFAGLISDVTLVREDGSQIALVGQFGAFDAAEGRLEVVMRGVPEGRFVGLGFAIGVPSEPNHADPNLWPADHPLNPLVNQLHWSWQGGYVFAALEGRWQDLTAPASGEERGFSYHLATDDRLMRVNFITDFAVTSDVRVAVAVDLAKVLGGLRLAANSALESTHSGSGDTLAPQLGAALERAWFWLGAQPTAPAGPTAAEELPPAAAIAGTTPLGFTVPTGFPQPSLPLDNSPTREGVALGEALFGDPRLSRDGTQSCASCHAPERAFSDSVALSRGVRGEPGTRNAMPLLNLAWSPHYAWDGSKPRIRDQALAAWTNPVEMAAEPAAVVRILDGDQPLRAKFAAAFGTREITPARMTAALEQYLLTLVSADTRFDRALRGVTELSVEEQRGFELFATEYDPVRGRRGADCFHCHGGALFTDFALKNNGLDLVSLDRGRAQVTGSAADAGKFKTPSLRNVALTAPYMHDGRFATLEDVVAHYDHGVQRAAALDPNLAKHPAEGLQLSAADQQALVAFLRTLTDVRFEPPRLAHSSPSQ